MPILMQDIIYLSRHLYTPHPLPFCEWAGECVCWGLNYESGLKR